ncbi:PPA1309 family protein [Kribbella sp. CA-293567]|uniref:PPA1309 family protein n=1 Tax=Kribbella sp. CA-293567 TaxID=3002436 RepID=UPI0022DCF657|nr:PPA1309 family protein [Kribbella sp. CA-293567]WBQ07102.1 PPA1309 family protein [Kribbella sp. CA-293567]
MHEVGPDNKYSDALGQAVIEIERHVSSAGWDQPAQLFALVPTEDLLAAEPQLAAELGADDASQPLTPVAQGELPGGMDDEHLAEALARIEWPDGVSGCAVAVERVVLPASAESGADTDAELAQLAGSDPRRHEVRMVAAVLRDGDRFGAVRLRTHDEDSAVLTGVDLVPTLCQVLSLTFEPSTAVGPGSVLGGTSDNEEKLP